MTKRRLYLVTGVLVFGFLGAGPRVQAEDDGDALRRDMKKKARSMAESMLPTAKDLGPEWASPWTHAKPEHRKQVEDGYWDAKVTDLMPSGEAATKWIEAGFADLSALANEGMDGLEMMRAIVGLFRLANTTPCEMIQEVIEGERAALKAAGHIKDRRKRIQAAEAAQIKRFVRDLETLDADDLKKVALKEVGRVASRTITEYTASNDHRGLMRSKGIKDGVWAIHVSIHLMEVAPGQLSTFPDLEAKTLAARAVILKAKIGSLKADSAKARLARGDEPVAGVVLYMLRLEPRQYGEHCHVLHLDMLGPEATPIREHHAWLRSGDYVARVHVSGTATTDRIIKATDLVLAHIAEETESWFD